MKVKNIFRDIKENISYFPYDFKALGLYGNTTSRIVEYTDVPTNIIVEERLPDTKFFRQEIYREIGSDSEKKALVITDPFARFTHNIFNNTLWYSLFMAGFDIYVMTDRPEKTTSFTDMIDKLDQIKPMSERQIRIALSKENLNDENMVIIDYGKAREILIKAEDQSIVRSYDFYLNQSSVVAYKTDDMLDLAWFSTSTDEEIMAFINAFNPEQEIKIYCSIDINQLEKILLFVVNYFNRIKLIDYKSGPRREKEDIGLFEETYKILKAHNLLGKIEGIRIYEPDESTEIEKFYKSLSEFQNIKDLSILNSSPVSTQYLEIFHKTLESITLIYRNYQEDLDFSWLNKCVRLNSISIENAPLSGDLKNFCNLKKIVLPLSNERVRLEKELKTLSVYAETLEALQLALPDDEDHPLDGLPQIKFNNLKHLKIIGGNNLLNYMLNASERLETLNYEMSTAREIETSCPLKQELLYLKTLGIRANARCISEIIKHTPNLETLICQKKKQTIGQNRIDLSEYPLSNLREINIEPNFVNIQGKKLQNNLSCIILNSCRKKSNFKNWETTSVKYLEIKESQISTETCADILHFAQNLYSLILNDCVISKNKSDLKDFPILRNLTVFRIIASSMPFPLMHKLITTSKKLNNLIIKHPITNYDVNKLEETSSPSCLERITIEFFNGLSEKDLIAVIAWLKILSIQAINIKYCDIKIPGVQISNDNEKNKRFFSEILNMNNLKHLKLEPFLIADRCKLIQNNKNMSIFYERKPMIVTPTSNQLLIPYNYRNESLKKIMLSQKINSIVDAQNLFKTIELTPNLKSLKLFIYGDSNQYINEDELQLDVNSSLKLPGNSLEKIIVRGYQTNHHIIIKYLLLKYNFVRTLTLYANPTIIALIDDILLPLIEEGRLKNLNSIVFRTFTNSLMVNNSRLPRDIFDKIKQLQIDLQDINISSNIDKSNTYIDTTETTANKNLNRLIPPDRNTDEDATNTTRNVSVHFYDYEGKSLHPGFYRFEALTTDERLNCIPLLLTKQLYTSYEIIDDEIDTEFIDQHKKDYYFNIYPMKGIIYGFVHIILDSNGWSKIKSKSAGEKLIMIQKLDFPFEIYYDQKFYYIKSKVESHKSFKLNFILFAQESKMIFSNNNFMIDNILKNSLVHTGSYPNFLQRFYNLVFQLNSHFIAKNCFDPYELFDALHTYFKDFKPKKIDVNCPTSLSFFQAAFIFKTGSCRHMVLETITLLRSMKTSTGGWLKTELDDLLNKITLMSNDLHIYLEYENKMIDLGGQPMRLKLKDLKPKGKKILKNIKYPIRAVETVSTAKYQPQIKSRFITTISPSDTFESFMAELLSSIEKQPDDNRNILLRFDREEEMDQFYLLLLQFSQLHHRKVHYIDDVEYIAYTDVDMHNTGVKPASETVNYVVTAEAGDMLAVNYTHLAPHLIGLNMMTDSSERRLGNNKIKPGLIIFGLYLNRQLPLSEEIASRYKLVAMFSSTFIHKLFHERSMIVDSTNTLIKTKTINLYHSHDWKSLLLRKLTLKNNKYNFQKQDLLNIITDEKQDIKKYIIVNPPHQRDFKLFIEALKIKKTFNLYGVTYYLPEDFQIELQDVAYDLRPIFTYELLSEKNKSTWDIVLNCNSYQCFFKNYACKDQLLSTDIDGWLAQYKNSKLTILVTSQLENGQWARLVDTAKEHNNQLHFIFLSPSFMPKIWCEMHAEFNLNHNSEKALLETKVINILETNDIEFVNAGELKKCQNSPITSYYLPRNKNNSAAFHTFLYNEETFSFHSNSSFIFDALQRGEVVVLKSNEISSSFADFITTLSHKTPYLYFNNKIHRINDIGKLIIITHDASKLSHFKQERIEVNKSDIQDFLKKALPDRLELIDAVFKFVENLEYVASNIASSHLNTAKNITLKWQYIHYERYIKRLLQRSNIDLTDIVDLMQEFILLSKDCNYLQQALLQLLPSKPDIDMIESNETADDFLNERTNAIKNVLDRSPCVLIVGESAVGKTTFILEDFASCYKKLTNIDVEVVTETADWIKRLCKARQEPIASGKKSLVVLFRDEANIETQDTIDDLCSNLYSDSPFIEYNNEVFWLNDPQIKDRFKIIFAGNPSHYAGRNNHVFFELGAIVAFKLFPDYFLKARVIAPIVDNTFSLNRIIFTNKLFVDIQNYILDIYHHINAMHGKTVLTPRNLGNIFLRWYLFYCLAKDDLAQYRDDFLTLSILAAIDEIVPFLPQKEQRTAFFAWLTTHINKEYPQYGSFESDYYFWIRLQQDALEKTWTSTRFVLTESRKDILRRCVDFLQIRNIKLKIPQLAHHGVPGMLFVGSSGMGKSLFLIELLKLYGYREGSSAANARSSNYLYYQLIPADFKTMEDICIKASKNKAILNIDELNTYPREIEQILNIHRHAGIFATQNPVFFKHRHELTFSQANRFYLIEVDDYSDDELLTILEHKGLSSSQAKELLAEYKQEKMNEDPCWPLTPLYLYKEAALLTRRHNKRVLSEPQVPNIAKRIKHEAITNSSLNLFFSKQDLQISFMKEQQIEACMELFSQSPLTSDATKDLQATLKNSGFLPRNGVTHYVLILENTKTGDLLGCLFLDISLNAGHVTALAMNTRANQAHLATLFLLSGIEFIFGYNRRTIYLDTSIVPPFLLSDITFANIHHCQGAIRLSFGNQGNGENATSQLLLEGFEEYFKQTPQVNFGNTLFFKSQDMKDALENIIECFSSFSGQQHVLLNETTSNVCNAFHKRHSKAEQAIKSVETLLVSSKQYEFLYQLLTKFRALIGNSQEKSPDFLKSKIRHFVA